MILDLRPIFRALPHFTRRFLPYRWYSKEWRNLNNELGAWLVPHLKEMRENGLGYPGHIEGEDSECAAKWNSVLDAMIVGFDQLASDDFFAVEDRTKIDLAFELLAEHWPSLWD